MMFIERPFVLLSGFSLKQQPSISAVLLKTGQRNLVKRFLSFKTQTKWIICLTAEI